MCVILYFDLSFKVFAHVNICNASFFFPLKFSTEIALHSGCPSPLLFFVKCCSFKEQKKKHQQVFRTIGRADTVTPANEGCSYTAKPPRLTDRTEYNFRHDKEFITKKEVSPFCSHHRCLFSSEKV